MSELSFEIDYEALDRELARMQANKHSFKDCIGEQRVVKHFIKGELTHEKNEAVKRAEQNDWAGCAVHRVGFGKKPKYLGLLSVYGGPLVLPLTHQNIIMLGTDRNVYRLKLFLSEVKPGEAIFCRRGTMFDTFKYYSIEQLEAVRDGFRALYAS